MARIPYADATTDPDLKDLAERIARERGGKLLNLYRALLNSPRLAQGWLHLFTVIRQQCDLPAQYRELVILSIALLNGAEYEYRQHVPHALAAGLTPPQLQALPNWKNSPLFDAAQRAVLGYAESMTRDIHVPDEAFAAVARHFPPRLLVELTATVAGYNMVSRFLEALQIDHED